MSQPLASGSLQSTVPDRQTRRSTTTFHWVTAVPGVPQALHTQRWAPQTRSPERYCGAKFSVTSSSRSRGRVGRTFCTESTATRNKPACSGNGRQLGTVCGASRHCRRAADGGQAPGGLEKGARGHSRQPLHSCTHTAEALRQGNSNGRTALLTQNVRNCRVAEVCWSQ